MHLDVRELRQTPVSVSTLAMGCMIHKAAPLEFPTVITSRTRLPTLALAGVYNFTRVPSYRCSPPFHFPESISDLTSSTVPFFHTQCRWRSLLLRSPASPAGVLLAYVLYPYIEIEILANTLNLSFSLSQISVFTSTLCELTSYVFLSVSCGDSWSVLRHHRKPSSYPCKVCGKRFRWQSSSSRCCKNAHLRTLGCPISGCVYRSVHSHVFAPF